MKRTLTIVLAAAVAIGLGAFFLVQANTPTEPVAVGSDTVIVDVRTAFEYAEGHLDGATLLDVSNGDLAAALPQLDADAPYVVYCRSGNRSAQAVQLMREAGFTNVTDLGSVGNASDATGIEIVR